MSDPIIVQCIVRDAVNKFDANNKVRKTFGYREMLRKYPPEKWNRKHIQTFHLNELWYIEFNMTPKERD